MSRGFWVYVNQPTNKAVVHLASCSFCANGVGKTADKSPYNGQWHGPFPREAALAAAIRAGKKDTRWCSLCAGALGIEDVAIRGPR